MNDTLSQTANASPMAFAAIAAVFVIGTVAAVWFMRRRDRVAFIRGGSNRRPRLSVRDAAAVDAHRRLVLVRRDDVEHLILIGGPSDIVIEAGIDRRAGQSQSQSATSSKPAICPSSVISPSKCTETEFVREQPAAKPRKTAISETVDTIDRPRSPAGPNPETRRIPASPGPARSTKVECVESAVADNPIESTAKSKTLPAGNANADPMTRCMDDVVEALQKPLSKPAAGAGCKTSASEQALTVASLSNPIDPVPAPPPPDEKPASSAELLVDFGRALEEDLRGGAVSNRYNEEENQKESARKTGKETPGEGLSDDVKIKR